MNIYWFSFSLANVNQGVCLIQADTPQEALAKCDNLKLTPEYDDIYCTESNDMSREAPLQFNRLYSPEEMIEFGYSLIDT
jgi:hypothetical protein